MRALSCVKTCRRPSAALRLPKPRKAGTQFLERPGSHPGIGRVDLTTELNIDQQRPSSADPRPGLLHNPAFMVILVATSFSSVGLAMFDTGSAWMMTSLNPSPRLVSAVQVVTTLPFFLLTLPAGALTDVVDPRRLLIAAELVVTAISIAFAAAVSAGLGSPISLLATSFLMGMGGALAAPAWLLINTILVRRAELDSAVALDTASYNVARAIGPAIAGYAIARLSIAVPFWGCCAGNLILLAALVWWRAPRRPTETLPAERLISAMTAGVRYVRYSREMDATLIRAIAFFPFASAYLALLPLVARRQGGDGAEVYGQLMAAIGVGSIAATFVLNWLKARLGANGQAALGTIGTIVSLFLLAAAREPVMALVASVISGAASIVALTTFFVSAQVTLPQWVRGRGLAIFLTVYFGALTLGSAVWGEVATAKGVPFALYAAGAGTLIGMALTWRWKLQTSEAEDLTPSMRWRAPCFLNRVTDDRGPILAIAEYRIDPKDSSAFLAIMQDVSLERRRDGAYAWHMFEDPDEEGKMTETYLIHSALELRYRRARVTVADEMMEERASQFLKAPAETRYLVAPQRPVRSRWRKPFAARVTRRAHG
jgi:predicted MFS family arabinose efflux permease